MDIGVQNINALVACGVYGGAVVGNVEFCGFV